jgi:3',5'-cyclic AMP phosphodiesterase CpdA
MRQVPSDFLVNTGDLVDNGASAEDWQSFFEIEAPLLRDRPLFVSIGNHELRDDLAGANFARYFGFRDQSGINRPYGTTRLGNTRFLFLNGMHDWSAGDEREWLERTLERSDAEADLVWRIAVVHHGPWSLGPHGANARLIAAGVPALLAAHKVDLLLSGHDHIYQRGNAGPLKYIVSGGGGAPLYGIEGTDPTERKAESTYHFVAVAVTEERIRTLAMRVDGTIIESCGFESRGAWECSPDVSMVAHSAAGPARSAPARSTSHCGCAVLGGWRIDAVVALGASALVGVTARHRRRMVRR